MQSSENIERLFVLDKETTFLVKTQNKRTKVISDEDNFESFISTGFNIREVIILVELKWESHSRQKYYGYEIAKRIMNFVSPSDSLNILFISVIDRVKLYNLCNTQNRIFVQKYPHTCLIGLDLGTVAIPVMSIKKFGYLKNYCLLKTGIIDRLSHDLRNLLANIDESKLSRFINDINMNREILTDNISNISNRLLQQHTEAEKKKLLSELQQSLIKLSIQLNESANGMKKKSHSRVILIEDDKGTLEKLVRQLGHYFQSITTFSNGSGAALELENNSIDYDVVITDMELLNDKFDDMIQGIDILELCENKYPHLVTRVITALPKNALKQLTGKGFDEIIFKDSVNESVIPPFENLVKFVSKIDLEVKKRKKLKSLQGPKLSWWGKHHTRKLYLLEINDPKKYSALWNDAFLKADAFINGEFDNLPNVEKLSIEFKAVKDTVDNPESGFEIIDLLLTHRLIALWYVVVKSKGKTFYWKGDDSTEYSSQLGFQDGLDSRTAKAYFTTFLGLSGKKLPNTSDGDQKCTMLLDNLFPKEYEYLTKYSVESISNILLCDINRDAFDFIQEFFKKYNKREITENINYSEVLELLSNFRTEYLDLTFDKKVHSSLKECVEEHYEYFSDSIPSDLKSIIKEIKDEIFQ